MSRRLPLFPLTVVLFPGTALPLHIFEPRYRRLLADCQAGDQRFGIVPFDATREAPPPGAVGCTAQIHVVQALAEGRANILVGGERRFLVTRYLDEDTPYYLGAVEEFDDQADSEPSAETIVALRAAYAAYLDLLRAVSDLADDEEVPADSVALSFHVAAALQIDHGAKQRLLQERRTDERVSLLLRLLPPATIALEHAVRVRRRAHTNGTGGGRPDIVAGA
jgi:Lon protease-like protein